MNRAERRKMKKSGKEVKSEPVYVLKKSEVDRLAVSDLAKEAMMKEINRQILEKDREYQLDVDTMVLWTLYQHYGWGKKRLREFYLAMFEEHLRMRDYYELDDLYPERQKLKEKVGVDIETWYNELFDEKGNFKNRVTVALGFDKDGKK